MSIDLTMRFILSFYLLENNLITSEHVMAAFRDVDRAFFVPEGNEDCAYSDRPLKSGNVHISAPHIYCTVVESLDLEPDSALSFLNIGSGTGYLSTIVAHILGPRSISFGVDIHEDVVEHSRIAIENWKSSEEGFADLSIDIFHGSGLEIDDEGESRMGYDRIYVGAAIGQSELQRIEPLLAPGGVLVAPVGDKLLKIMRMRGSQSGSLLGTGADNDDSEFSTEVITGVHFASLLNNPKKSVVIPSKVWCPSSHHYFSENFQKCTTALLLCSRSAYIQPLVPTNHNNRINVSATLPKDVLVHILSFANRKWFESDKNEVEILKKRLRQERGRRDEAKQEFENIRTSHRAIECERDLYLNFILRWHHILSRNESEREEEDSPHPYTRNILEEANTILSPYHARSQLMETDSLLDEEDGSRLDDEEMDIGLENESNQMMVHSDNL